MISMKRLLISLTGPEYEALRRVAFERHVSMAEAIRQILDDACGTTHDDVGRRRGRPKTERKA